jgi:DNA-binding response OmpR family regulator
MEHLVNLESLNDPDTAVANEDVLPTAEFIFNRNTRFPSRRLRRKVERNPTRPMAIRTVRGVGYLFDPEAV